MRKTLMEWCALLALLAVGTGYLSADAKSEFKDKCAPCHGKTGAGDSKLGENLRVRDLGSPDVQKQSDAELEAIIVRGRGKMPAYGGKLSKEQIDEIVKWIRMLKR